MSNPFVAIAAAEPRVRVKKKSVFVFTNACPLARTHTPLSYTLTDAHFINYFFRRVLQYRFVHYVFRFFFTLLFSSKLGGFTCSRALLRQISVLAVVVFLARHTASSFWPPAVRIETLSTWRPQQPRLPTIKTAECHLRCKSKR